MVGHEVLDLKVGMNFLNSKRVIRNDRLNSKLKIEATAVEGLASPVITNRYPLLIVILSGNYNIRRLLLLSEGSPTSNLAQV